ncbi:hypothetical protein DFP72DRAFT_604536 [Ephemerocybe angulata]|uniref:Homeobox domain-containing protein n=1 Tax=Ephemerocybe angulata TaxID=980116 RepID=A0A8H6HKM8_9AGAR|nr:hypothetical protein DFP72DRAFT_604536 [Tulosesus angulatus]
MDVVRFGCDRYRQLLYLPANSRMAPCCTTHLGSLPPPQPPPSPAPLPVPPVRLLDALKSNQALLLLSLVLLHSPSPTWMSKSRSSTPTQKPSGARTNISTIDDLTPGPSQPHESTATPTRTNISSRTELSPAFPSNIPPITTPVPSTRTFPYRGTIRKAETDIEDESEPMAKRMRRGSLEQHASPVRHHHEDSRSSPSSDSQSGMADTELDRKKAGESASSIGSTTQKKKRTRTLTTPHQAAVLHALLAQSRFPTTAMREEVGRAIGLSARKVQVRFVSKF